MKAYLPVEMRRHGQAVPEVPAQAPSSDLAGAAHRFLFLVTNHGVATGLHHWRTVWARRGQPRPGQPS